MAPWRRNLTHSVCCPNDGVALRAQEFPKIVPVLSKGAENECSSQDSPSSSRVAIAKSARDDQPIALSFPEVVFNHLVD